MHGIAQEAQGGYIVERTGREEKSKSKSDPHCERHERIDAKEKVLVASIDSQQE